MIDELFVKICPLKLVCHLFVCLLREKLLTGTFSVNHALLSGTVPLGIYQRQEIEMYLSTYLAGLSQKTILEYHYH